MQRLKKMYPQDACHITASKPDRHQERVIKINEF